MASFTGLDSHEVVSVKDTVLIHTFQPKLFCCSDNNTLLLPSDVAFVCHTLIPFEVYLESRQREIQRLLGSPFTLWKNGFVIACDLHVVNGTRKLQE